jgi:hypothetical protein
MTRVADRHLERVATLLGEAGEQGLSAAELREHMPDFSRSTVYAVLVALITAGRAVMERRHPVARYYAPSVPEAARKTSFAQHATQELARRGAAVSQAMKGKPRRRRATVQEPAAPAKDKARNLPAGSPRHAVRAVDPRALRADATVTHPASVETVICPPYRTRLERLVGEQRAASLPTDPPSAWAQAAIQSRSTHQEPS